MWLFIMPLIISILCYDNFVDKLIKFNKEHWIDASLTEINWFDKI